jgi:hypothetical protein
MLARDFLEQNKDSVIAEYNSGVSAKKLAEKYNFDDGTIKRFLKSHNVLIRGRDPKHGTIDNFEEDILRLFKEGKSLLQIEKAVGFRFVHLRDFLRKHGIDHKTGNVVDVSEHKEEIINRYGEGWLPDKIAEHFKCNKHHVTYLLKKWGFTVGGTFLYSVDMDFFKRIDNEVKAYCLGFFFLRTVMLSNRALLLVRLI